MGVFIGYDNPQPMGHGETGGGVAAPIFADFFKLALKDKPDVPFRTPPDIRMVMVNKHTALGRTGTIPTPSRNISSRVRSRGGVSVAEGEQDTSPEGCPDRRSNPSARARRLARSPRATHPPPPGMPIRRPPAGYPPPYNRAPRAGGLY